MGRIFNHRQLNPPPTHYRAAAWEDYDLHHLARAIAQLALGQCQHVERLLKSTDNWIHVNADYAVNSAIELLTVHPGKDPWHRDGWVFQLISWIAAIEESNGPTRMPQMDQASKGFDGLQLEISPIDGQVSRAIIFEDKATTSPRGTVRDDAWPSFRQVEAGEKNSALGQEIGYLVSQISNIDITKTIDRLMRTPEARAYRISVTVKNYHAQHPSFNGLFDGFETIIPGNSVRRRGNIFEVDDLRTWMSNLCNLAAYIIRTNHV